MGDYILLKKGKRDLYFNSSAPMKIDAIGADVNLSGLLQKIRVVKIVKRI
jgi:hypothetical protein